MVKEVLKYLNWNMGNKLIIDLVMMFNKGLEVMEVYWLFGVDYDDIEVVI